ncbi:hypothetical protein ACFW9F_29365 [Streptomyces sp. NPDC059506]|uniref:hypothetical protein n=1 Tax=Streptomyces sp. NPDC059506 TaxID=3347751 RepID=UPI0036B736BF
MPKPPKNEWTELTEERRAAIDARDLSGWSLAQVRAEIRRRRPHGNHQPVAYWLERLTAREAALQAEHALRNLPRHPGLRVVPNRARAPWTYRITLAESGKDLIGLDYPGSRMAHEAADRLVATCDWKVPAAEHSAEHRAAAAAERARLEQSTGFSSWPQAPESPAGL